MAKKASGLDKVHNLSDEMSDFMGKDRASRAQITKKFWTYVKNNDLQNPNNRREVILDETLQEVFGCKKMTMFQLGGKISEHIVD